MDYFMMCGSIIENKLLIFFCSSLLKGWVPSLTVEKVGR